MPTGTPILISVLSLVCCLVSFAESEKIKLRLPLDSKAEDMQAGHADVHPAGITFGPATLGGGDNTPHKLYVGQQARLSVREPNHSLSFTLNIDASHSLSLSQLNFHYGFDESFHPNKATPGWSLHISRGHGIPSTKQLPTITETSQINRHESIQLAGLKNLSNTKVTFTLTFHTKEKRHGGLNRAHIIENLSLSGTYTSSRSHLPAPSTLLGIGGISVVCP